MTAHSNSEILKAYADNTELVIFMLGSSSKWHRTNPRALMDYPDDEFFACLPQHEKSTLHALNGGEVQYKAGDNLWMECIPYYGSVVSWSNCWWYMLSDTLTRIKPRKEKRWVAACNSGRKCIDQLFDNKNQAKEFVTAFYPNNRVDDFQYIEIEVEV